MIENSLNMIYRYMRLTEDDCNNLEKISNLDDGAVNQYINGFSPLESNPNHRLLNLIWDGRLRLSQSKYFNDPYDCFPRVDRSITNEVLCERLCSIISTIPLDCEQCKGQLNSIRTNCTSYLNNSNNKERAINLLECAFRRQALNVKILSFSKTYTNLLLWAHYADAHKGFCIAVDRSQIRDLMQKEVTYSENRPEINFYNNTNNTGHEFTDKLILTKSKDWEYEKEVRCYVYHRNEEYLILNKNAIRCIIFGSKMSLQYKKAIYKIVDQANQNNIASIQLLEASLDNSRYAMKVSEYTFR